MMSIQAVVFDYGGVICNPPPPEAVGELAAMAGAPREKFEPLLWRLRREFDRGTVSALDYYKDMLARLGVEKDDAFIQAMIDKDLSYWKNLNPESVRLLEDIKKSPLRLGILSNMPVNFLAWARKNIYAFSLPDPDIAVFSCEVRQIKPEPAIYQTLVNKTGLPPESIVFFDDMEENITAARASGLRGFLWQGAEKARGQLRELGVKL